VCVDVRHAVVRTRREMSSTPVARSAHLADAALYQSSAVAAQHWQIHARRRRATDAHGVATDARNVARYVSYTVLLYPTQTSIASPQGLF